jgi:hypothetical protein
MKKPIKRKNPGQLKRMIKAQILGGIAKRNLKQVVKSNRALRPFNKKSFKKGLPKK